MKKTLLALAIVIMAMQAITTSTNGWEQEPYEFKTQVERDAQRCVYAVNNLNIRRANIKRLHNSLINATGHTKKRRVESATNSLNALEDRLGESIEELNKDCAGFESHQDGIDELIIDAQDKIQAFRNYIDAYTNVGD